LVESEVASFSNQCHNSLQLSNSERLSNLTLPKYQQMDDTATRVDGVNQHCHVVCNPLYTVTAQA
jgi:hypothetical protein